MHCPKCGQQQISEETRFCSRCGLLLTAIADLVAAEGIVPTRKNSLAGTSGSPRRRGVMQGAFLFLLTFLVVPILVMISIALGIEPFLPVIGMFLFGVGGLLRMIYALMFQSGTANDIGTVPGSLPSGADTRNALPPSYSTPASTFTGPAGSWRDTNDLQREPASVTDHTTKLLQKDEADQ